VKRVLSDARPTAYLRFSDGNIHPPAHPTPASSCPYPVSRIDPSNFEVLLSRDIWDCAGGVDDSTYQSQSPSGSHPRLRTILI
jgi:hypothetical protein